MDEPRPALILGSTSPYRRELLERLRQPFSVIRPDVDETPNADEAPDALATRLALAKARSAAALAAAQHADPIVIGSDQVADLDGQPLGKPGTHERALQQLQQMRGRKVRFHTAVTVLRPRTRFERTLLATVTVRFRPLQDPEIARYLAAEQPYDCAGSAKAEALGITLLESIESDDPTALIGLPLIRTCALLREAGLQLP